MRRNRGFVFSLDAFVAFSLILIAIQTMVLISASPSGYWRALLQAQFLAKDTLNDISTTMTINKVSALGEASGRIVSGQLSQADLMIQISDKIIQKPYSYSYSYYDMNTDTWRLVYNASNSTYEADGSHANITFRRVEASAQKLMLDYSSPPVRPESPYCNVYCKGWLGTTGEYTEPPISCVQTPCDAMPASTYQYGNLTFGLLRLTVWG